MSTSDSVAGEVEEALSELGFDMLDLKEEADTLAGAVVNARERTAEALRNHAVLMMRLNAVRVVRDAPPEEISDRATAMRQNEKLLETLIGEECEAWMNYYEAHGIPAEEAPNQTPTSAARWVKSPRLNG